MASKKIIRATAADLKRLELENALVKSKISLAERTIENSLSGLASGLSGGGFGGGQMSSLTSLNPTQNNSVYAPVTLLWTSLMYVFKSHGLITTAIEMPVLDALRGGLDYTSGQLDSKNIKALQDRLEEDAVMERVADAFVWARLFGGGALVINSEADSEEPLGDEVTDGGKIALYDASRWELVCERRIPKNGYYGFYGKQVHESRVLTILGRRAPWLIRAQLSDWGLSVYEGMMESWNLYLRGRNVLYELLEEAKVDVYSLKGFSGQLASPNGTSLTQRRIQATNQIKNYNNAIIVDSEDKYDFKEMTFSGLAEMLRENRMEVAAALRMPVTKLFGAGANGGGGLNSTNDELETYNSMIESEIRQPMRQILRKVINLYVRNMFGEEMDIEFNFKPLRILSAVDEENIKSSQSNRTAALYDRMIISSKEYGEILTKDNLVPIKIKAERGLLDDHPMTPDQEMAQKIGEAGGGDEEDGKSKKVGGKKDSGMKPTEAKAATKLPKAEKKPSSPKAD